VKKLIILAVFLICGNAFSATLLDEQFDYPTGMLTDVSGGNWDTWLGTSQDAAVVAKMLLLDGIGTPEVCTYFSNALPGAGTMTAAFDFFVHEEDQADLDTYVMLGGGTEATSEIDYNLWGFIVDWGASPGATQLHLWDLDGVNGGGDYGVAELATGLTVDAWHTVELEATQTVVDPLANAAADADGLFRVFLDGALVMDWTPFGNNSVNGINSVDIYNFDDGEQHDFTAFDNIVVTGIPEPGTISLIGAGLVGLLALRRRKK
jgi:hypothetical protein